MIPYLNDLMSYYDIHTHQKPLHREDRSIINIIVGLEESAISDIPAVSCGIHPWHIIDANRQLSLLRKLAFKENVVAIGEAGFDPKAKVSMKAQKELFEQHAFLAEESAKPLIIHCVKAWDDLIACRKEINPQMPWIIHGFRGKEQLAKQLMRQGFYLSFGIYFNHLALQAAWPDRFFLETDDKSIDIREVYVKAAETLVLSDEIIQSQLLKNSSLFHLKG